MSVWGDRLTWVNDYYSYASLSRDYGIPYKTVLSAKNTGVIPSGYQDSFTTLWKTTSYAIMRTNNVPSYSANIRRGGALSSVIGEINGWNGLYDEWALGAAGTRAMDYDQSKWTGSVWADFYTIRSKIVASSQKSILTSDVAQERNTSG